MQYVYCEVHVIFTKKNFSFLIFNFEGRSAFPSTHYNTPHTAAGTSACLRRFSAGVYAIDAGR